MPRYFFNIQDSQMMPDDTGMELTDDDAAHSHAIEVSEAILHRQPADSLTNPWRVIIKDADGELLGTVTSVFVPDDEDI